MVRKKQTNSQPLTHSQSLGSDIAYKKVQSSVALEKVSSEAPEAVPLASQIEQIKAIDSFKESWKPMNGTISISQVFFLPKKGH
jgi:hypothetical protein